MKFCIKTVKEIGYEEINIKVKIEKTIYQINYQLIPVNRLPVCNIDAILHVR